MGTKDTRDDSAERHRFLYENQSMRLRIQALEAEVERSRRLSAVLEEEREALKQQVQALAEALIPIQVTELRRRPEMVSWGLNEWLAWFTAVLMEELRILRSSADPSAGLELLALRKRVQELAAENRRLAEALSFERQARRWAESRLLVREKYLSPGRDRQEAVGAGPHFPSPPPVSQGIELASEENARRFGPYWKDLDRGTMDNLIRLIAKGEDCRRRPLAEMLGKSYGGRIAAYFHRLVEGGFLEEVRVTLGQGAPAVLVRLTERGQELARALGVPPTRGLDELRRRHRSDAQVLLALRARDVLTSWGYRVELWPRGFTTPSGRECRPDLLVISSEGEIFVEVEVHAFGGRWQAYGRNLERIGKWRIFAEVNQGVIAIVGPNSAVEDALKSEIALWHRLVGEGPLTLLTMNTAHPGEDWTRTVFRK